VFLHLEAEAGAVLAVPGERDLLVVAVTRADVNVGLVRLELRRAADRLA
jgi:predicted regulator of Ras-like GTPase activity (Roadblock/LC7/MglB family)